MQAVGVQGPQVGGAPLRRRRLPCAGSATPPHPHLTQPLPCTNPLPRSYHSATLVGGEVWICGGSEADSVLGDVFVFNPTTRTFRQPRLRGDLTLLKRTAHDACVHPLRPHCLLLFGGYGGQIDTATQEYT